MNSKKPLVTIHRKKDRFTKPKRQTQENHSSISGPSNELNDTQLKTMNKHSIDELNKIITNALGNTSDLKTEKVKIAEVDSIIFYLESVIELRELQKMFFNKETSFGNQKTSLDPQSEEEMENLCNDLFGGGRYQFIQTDDDVINHMLNGNIIMAIKTFPKFISINIPIENTRSIEEPSTQTVIRGPKDGFIEGYVTNQSLIRRRIRNSKLRFEEFTLGKDTKTKVAIGYMDGIANESIIEEVRKRLNKIKVSAIFESGNIEELISDKSSSVFPLALNTERPDTTAAHLIEGKICIIVDGSPFVLIVPAVFTDFFTSSEDYYNHFVMSSFLRVIRYLSFLIVLIVPSAYVGVLTYHQELIPTYLLLNIIAQREGVPFPAVVEVLLMELVFEILREAGIRMPRAVGQTVSIVGALVIGQAAAQAGIISNIMVIIVAITATANFVAPVYSLSAATRILRLILVPIAAFLGLYGVLLGLIVMVAHLASLRSFGVPYLAPIAPFSLKNQRDVIFRMPYWALNRRPTYLRTLDQPKNETMGSPTPPDMLRRNKG
ncbi:spore germination protein [Niallia sp. Krafla_26]|uniref:spore germination protein n=1 Tax=Niallia sp. Krafla_26 TaxID=3064703 RepID=UPI003D166D86